MVRKNNNYEAPSVELCRLGAEEELLRPTVSEGGFGFDDEGPDARRANGE